MSRLRHLLIALAVFLGLAGLTFMATHAAQAGPPASPLAEPTVFATRIFQQGLGGYTGTKDVTIALPVPDDNQEGQSTLKLEYNDHTQHGEQYSALLSFDLSGIPRNAHIQGATLSMVVNGRNAADDLGVYLVVLSRTWQANQVTWNEARAGQPWATPGANDYLVERRLDAESGTWFNWAIAPPMTYTWDAKEAVQYWVEQPQWNAGAKLQPFMVRGIDMWYTLHSSEAASLPVRPSLLVTYTLDAAVPTPTDVPATPTVTPTRIPSQPTLSASFRQGAGGYSGIQDTYIDRRYPDVNYSDVISLHLRYQQRVKNTPPAPDTYVYRNESNPLLRFDVSSIPPHALVTSAQLQVYHFDRSGCNTSYLDVTSTMVLRDWSAPEATWNQAAAGVPWYVEGAGKPERDYRRRETDLVTIPGVAACPPPNAAWYTFEVGPMAQEWVQRPDRNFGVILKPEVEANVGFTFYSSEVPTTSLRPRLVVKYWLPLDVPTATATATGPAGPSATPTRTGTPTATASATATPTNTTMPSQTPTPSPSTTSTPTPTTSATPSPTPTSTNTATATATPTATATHTRTPAPSPTATSPTLASIPLVTGANLVSIPLNPASPAIEPALASIAGRYSKVFAFNGATKEWRSYDVALPGWANTLHYLDASMGFWIYMDEPASLQVAGEPAPITSIALSTGANLIGFPRAGAQPIAEALANIEGLYSKVFEYDAATLTWKSYDTALPAWANTLTELRPGHAYWIYALYDCYLDVFY